MSEETQEIETVRSAKSQLTLKIVGAAIFGGLSIAISFIAAFIPRHPLGFAYFDPVSIIWVLCFQLFGPLAGILCSIIGMLGLMPFDPFAPLGPFLKFAATIPMIIGPTIILKLYKKDGYGSEKLKNPKKYAIVGVLSILLRLGIMIPLNIIVYPYITGSMEGIGGWILFAFVFNILQSIWDLLIPYLIVFKGKLDEKFEIW